MGWSSFRASSHLIGRQGALKKHYYLNQVEKKVRGKTDSRLSAVPSAPSEDCFERFFCSFDLRRVTGGELEGGNKVSNAFLSEVRRSFLHRKSSSENNIHPELRLWLILRYKCTCNHFMKRVRSAGGAFVLRFQQDQLRCVGVGGRQLFGKTVVWVHISWEKHDYQRASGVGSELVCCVAPPPGAWLWGGQITAGWLRLSGGSGGTEQGCGGVASLMTKQPFSSGLW